MYTVSEKCTKCCLANRTGTIGQGVVYVNYLLHFVEGALIPLTATLHISQLKSSVPRLFNFPFETSVTLFFFHGRIRSLNGGVCT